MSKARLHNLEDGSQSTANQTLPVSEPIPNAAMPEEDATNTASPGKPDLEGEINRLAALDSIVYDQSRKAAAKALGVRAETLDRKIEQIRGDRAIGFAASMFPTVEPWQETVIGAALLSDIEATIRRFIICEPETRIAATLWIAFSWLIDAVQVAPLAVITAPEKRCGKTQLLDLIRRLARKPLVAANISSAAVFRVIEAHRPTLLIDEADAFMRENEELRGVINSGHTRTSAYVIRTVGEDLEPKQFSTWGAKVLCGIGTLPETLMDRAIVLELRRKLPSESVGRLRHAEPGMFIELARKLARFAQDNEHRVRVARPALPDQLNDRAQDNWEPLLAIADIAGGDWPEQARRAALKISGEDTATLSTGAELLADIRAAFDQDRSDRLAVASLIARLTADELAPWAGYNRGKPISPRQLGKRLAEYGIRTRSLWIGSGSAKGFDRSDFADVWARYLDAPPASPLSVGVSVRTEQDQQVSSSPNITGITEHHRTKTPSVMIKPLISLTPHQHIDGNPSETATVWETTI